MVSSFLLFLFGVWLLAVLTVSSYYIVRFRDRTGREEAYQRLEESMHKAMRFK